MMIWKDLSRTVALVILVACAIVVSPVATRAKQTDDLAALNRQVAQLRQTGKYVEATDIAKRLLAATERQFGSNDVRVAKALYILAELYGRVGRFGEVEPLYKRALEIHEKALGSKDPDVGADLNNLAGLYESQGRYDDAEQLYERALAIYEQALPSKNPRAACPSII